MGREIWGTSKLVGPCASIINVCLRQAGHELDLALANSVTMCIIFILPNFIVMYIMFLVLNLKFVTDES
jgi:hypothetical protein